MKNRSPLRDWQVFVLAMAMSGLIVVAGLVLSFVVDLAPLDTPLVIAVGTGLMAGIVRPRGRYGALGGVLGVVLGWLGLFLALAVIEGSWGGLYVFWVGPWYVGPAFLLGTVGRGAYDLARR